MAANPTINPKVEAVEQKVSGVEFRQYCSRPGCRITYLGTFSTGTRYKYELGGIRRFYLVTDADFTASLSFSKITPGNAVQTANGSYYEISGGFVEGFMSPNYYSRKDANTVRQAITYFVSPEGFTLGDPTNTIFTSIGGLFVSNAGRPWRDFLLDNDTNVTLALAGKLRRNDSVFSYQGSLSDNANTQRFKSFCQLWETGTQAADGVASSFTVTFTNAQKNAAYFVVLEPANTNQDNLIAQIAKTNAGFTMSFTAVPSGFDSWTWFAVRYGV